MLISFFIMDYCMTIKIPRKTGAKFKIIKIAIIFLPIYYVHIHIINIIFNIKFHKTV